MNTARIDVDYLIMRRGKVIGDPERGVETVDTDGCTTTLVFTDGVALGALVDWDTVLLVFVGAVVAPAEADDAATGAVGGPGGI